MDLQESERNPNFISVDVEFCSCDHNIQIQDSSIYIDLFFILPLGILDLSEVLEHQCISMWVLALE